ncbi:MAG: hypothetical protein ACYDCG_14550 [Candidatus Acidiferrales bacterium]
MRNRSIQVALILLLGMLSPIVLAQDKTKSDDKAKAEVQSTSIKLQIVFAEFDADKKVKSLPYVMYMNAPDAAEIKPGWDKLRIGSRIPVYTGNSQMQYQDVGTNIDARSAYADDGHLLLQLDLERSWVEGDVSVPITKADAASSDTSSGHFREPIIRSFRSELYLKLREGQPVESTVATDPISGKIMKVEISFTVVK